LPRALLCAYRVADVKEFVALSAQMLNTRSFPCFASITEQIAANLNLIRSGYPPLVPVLGTNISQAEVRSQLHF
uniref:DNA mismatch repair protein MutL n=1 Tax=Gongylonema pulchrum TaxID=637853 RepID=A0A183DMB6_9BILA